MPVTRWQYRIVNIGSFNTGDRLRSALGRLGAGGWELVTVFDKSSNWIGGMEKGFALFKRPVDDEAEVPEGGWAILDSLALDLPGGKPAEGALSDEQTW